MRNAVSMFPSPVLKIRWVALALLLALSFATRAAQAQSLGYEGPTGVFVTPLALTAASPANGVGTPSVAYHFLAGGPVIGDFSTISTTMGFAKRFEIGYTHELHNEDGGSTAEAGLTPLWNSGLDIVSVKANILPDSYKKLKWVPAVSVGGLYRSGDQIGANINDLAAALIIHAGLTPVYAKQKTANGDIYVVATKLITAFKPLPILASAGLRGTNASLWGLGGNSPGFEGKLFGSAAFVVKGPFKSTIIPAFEIAEQPQHISSATATATLGSAKAATLFDIPTSEVYAVRIVPFAKKKLNVDGGILHAGGYIDNPLLNGLAGGKINLDMRARVAFGVSYGF